MILSFASALVQIAPAWLRRTRGAALLRALGAPIDTLVQRTRDSVKLRFPGHPSADTAALPIIGRERRIRRGPGESDVTYASRLQRWWDDHLVRGGYSALMQQLKAYWAAAPRKVEVVFASGHRWTLDDMGNITHDVISWDPVGDPLAWANVWVFYYQQGQPYTLTPDQVETYVAVPREWNAAHIIMRAFLLWSAYLVSTWSTVVTGYTEDLWVCFRCPDIGKYVAAGLGGRVLVSTNRTAWTSIASGTTVFRAGAWNGTMGILVGDSGKIQTTTDFTLGSLTPITVGGLTMSLRGVCWDGVRWLIGGFGGILRSTASNGSTWAYDYTPPQNITDIQSNGVVTVAVGYNGYIGTAPAGSSTWTDRSSGVALTFQAVAPLPGVGATWWIAVGNSGACAVSGDNGANWVPITLPYANDYYAVGEYNGTILAAGTSGRVIECKTPFVFTDPDVAFGVANHIYALGAFPAGPTLVGSSGIVRNSSWVLTSPRLWDYPPGVAWDDPNLTWQTSDPIAMDVN